MVAKKNPTKLTYIDLFAGAGGFSVGFDKAGFQNVFALDFDPTFCKTYTKNFPEHLLIQKDVSDVTHAEIKEYVKGKKIDVVIGGPPCQGFSIAGNIGRKFIDDPRNHLFKEFVRVVSLLKPKFFVMENVARLYTHNGGKTRGEIIKSFERLGYTVDCKVLTSSEYNVPQVRNRVVFIGNITKQEIIFPEANKSKTISVGDAIADLPKLKSGEKSVDIPNHAAMNHTDQMLKKMGYVTDGGTRDDIPKRLRPASGDVRKYIRYNSKKPAVTITGDMRKVFHYSQNRALTVRELARLQSFDDDFIFEGNSISQQQQVGNAVPPRMALAIAESIKSQLLL